MRNLKGLLTIFMIGIFMLSTQAQSLSGLSDSELEAKKAEAIASENYELANQIKSEQSARKSIDDKLIEKNEELKAAIANENYAKAEQLKKEIAQLEKDKAKLTELEEDRKIAIFEERYDDVIAIEGQMTTIKKGETTTPTDIQTEQVQKLLEQYQPTTNNNTLSTANPTKTKLKKVDLDDVEYNDKVIGQIGYGRGSFEYQYTLYDYYWDNFGNYIENRRTETINQPTTAYSASFNRWWINKYLAGGLFFDLNINNAEDDFGLYPSYGAQITGFADFDSQILPYSSFGVGTGFKGEYDGGDYYEGVFYIPVVFKLGSNFFFKKNRGFGLFAELNLYLNNSNMPKWRVGLVWSRVKRRARK